MLQRHIWIVIVGCILLAGFVGCSKSGESADLRSCSSRADCLPCEYCGAGFCIGEPDYCVACIMDSQCPDGMRCETGLRRCVQKTPVCYLGSDCSPCYSCYDGSCIHDDLCTPCDSHDDCAAVEHCDFKTGVCTKGTIDGDDDPDVDTDPLNDDLDPTEGADPVDTDEQTVDVPEAEVDFDTDQIVECTASGSGAVIGVDPVSRTLDFGGIQVGLYELLPVTLCNQGNQSFAVTNINLSIGASTEFHVLAATTPFNLEPGTGIVVGVVYSPRDYVDDYAKLTILSGAAEQEVNIQLVGRTKSVGELTAAPMIAQWQYTAGLRTISLRNIGSASLVLNNATVENGTHFSVTGALPDFLGGAYIMEQNEEVLVTVNYDGEKKASNTYLLIDYNNHEQDLTLRVELQPGGGAVCALPDAGPDQVVPPLATVQLDGSGSFDPNDAPENANENWYFWKLEGRPEGAVNSIILDRNENPIDGVWSSEPTPHMFAELTGLYEISLRINPDDDAGCANKDTTVIKVIPDETIHIQLRWNRANSDHDIHLVRHKVMGSGTIGCLAKHDPANEDAGEEYPNDCYFRNCNTRKHTVVPDNAPDWGALSQTSDDPSLDIDDRLGKGPENLNLSLPEVGWYWIAVENYGGEADSLPTKAVVKVWLFGEFVGVFGAAEITGGKGNHWNVAWVHVKSSTDIEILPIVNADGGYVIKSSATTDCQPDPLRPNP